MVDKVLEAVLVARTNVVLVGVVAVVVVTVDVSGNIFVFVVSVVVAEE